MIGKSLGQRHTLGALAADRAVSIVTEALGAQGKLLIRVRAQDPRMVACLIVRADEATVRVCRTMGLRVKPGGTVVVGLPGSDIAKFFPQLEGSQRDWLAVPCGPRQVKVLLMAGGLALVSVDTEDGKVEVSAVP